MMFIYHSSIPALFIGEYLQVGSDAYRTLLKFDLSSIPLGNTILSTIWKLFVGRKDKPGSLLAVIYICS